MLRKSIEWRQTYKVDDALNWRMDEKLVAEFPLSFPGVDFKNRAVFYIPVGSWHIREMIEKGHRDEMLQYIYVVLERLIAEVEKTGEQFTMVVDLEGMTYWKVAHLESKSTFHINTYIALRIMCMQNVVLCLSNP